MIISAIFCKKQIWLAALFSALFLCAAQIYSTAAAAGKSAVTHSATLPISNILHINDFSQETPPPLTEDEIFPNLNPLKNGKGVKKPQSEQDNLSAKKDLGFSAAQKRRQEQDKLFGQLKHTSNVDKAAELSRAIEGLWAQSGSESVDLLMFWANKEISEKNYAIALDFLDNVVAFAPDYAEGWMRRASVHLVTGDIPVAMAEIQRVLQLEPRHYNAMLQLGAVLEITDRPEKALNAYEKALELYPQMQSARRRVQILVEKGSSRAI